MVIPSWAALFEHCHPQPLHKNRRLSKNKYYTESHLSLYWGGIFFTQKARTSMYKQRSRVGRCKRQANSSRPENKKHGKPRSVACSSVQTKRYSANNFSVLDALRCRLPSHLQQEHVVVVDVRPHRASRGRVAHHHVIHPPRRDELKLTKQVRHLRPVHSTQTQPVSTILDCQETSQFCSHANTQANCASRRNERKKETQKKDKKRNSRQTARFNLKLL